MFEKCSFYSTIQGLKIPKFTVCLTDDRSTNARQYSIPHTKNLKVLRQWILKFSSPGELKKMKTFQTYISPFICSYRHRFSKVILCCSTVIKLLPWTDLYVFLLIEIVATCLLPYFVFKFAIFLNIQ